MPGGEWKRGRAKRNSKTRREEKPTYEQLRAALKIAVVAIEGEIKSYKFDDTEDAIDDIENEGFDVSTLRDQLSERREFQATLDQLVFELDDAIAEFDGLGLQGEE